MISADRVKYIRVGIQVITEDGRNIGELAANVFRVPEGWEAIRKIETKFTGAAAPMSGPGVIYPTREGPEFDFVLP